MTLPPHDPEHEALLRRIERDLIDGYDEELELEIEDRELHGIDRPAGSGDTDGDRLARQRDSHALFRLQGELVKLHDCVTHTRHKVVILFEARDAAGKGGVIKCITQRLNPRMCRILALPAPNGRDRTHIARRSGGWCRPWTRRRRG